MKPKKILITGAAQRVGAELARILHQQGHQLAITYNNSAAAAKELQQELAGLKIYQTDFCDSKNYQNLIKQIAHDLAGLDVLINNAAIFIKDDNACPNTELLEKHLAVNFVAPVALTQQFIEITKQGLVINITDKLVAAQQVKKFMSYVLSKKALSNYTEFATANFAPAIKLVELRPELLIAGEYDQHKKIEQGALAAFTKQVVDIVNG